ncbi:MAG: ATPase domain-containing protein [Deferrisomatales bacterium]
MLKNEMVAKSPLRALDQTRDGGLMPGQIGLVAARAGTGKTAFLTHVALDNLFRGNSVLHVSLGETVGHVKAWYDEVYRDLAADCDLERAREVWEEAERIRMIMTFRVQAFTVDKLEERLSDLVEQGVFRPKVVLVDRLDLNDEPRPTLEALGRFARAHGLKVWVSCRSHRDMGDLRQAAAGIEDLCQVIVGLEPRGESVALQVLKNPAGGEGKAALSLDPRTLLLVSGA